MITSKAPIEKIRKITGLLKDESGGIATMTVFMMPMLMGFLGVSIDMSNWYMVRRDLQTITDVAAMEAAHLENYYDTSTEVKTALTSWLSTKGYNSSSDTMTVSIPPVSGDFIGVDGYVEVEIHRATPLFFTSAFFALFNDDDFDVSVGTRAVAGGVGFAGGDGACVVAFNTNVAGALDFSGNAGVDAECGSKSFSNHLQSIEIGGSSTVLFKDVTTAGDIHEFGSGNLSLQDEATGSINTFAATGSDPFESMNFPANQECDHDSEIIPGKNDSLNDRTLSPGVYCGGITIGSNVDLYLEPGVYYIQGSDLYLQGDLSIDTTTYFGTDPGVSIIFTEDGSGDVGTISKWNAQGTVNLTATNSGEYAGLVFAQDPDAPENSVKMNGGAGTIIDGALYFPNGDLQFNGGSSNDGCLLLYADTIEFTGTNTVNIDMDTEFCEALGLGNDVIAPASPRNINLME